MDLNTIVSGRWRLAKRLGFGSFGDIYSTVDEQTGNFLAAKVEVANTRYPQLHLEFKVYKSMANYNGFPRVYWRGEASLNVGGKLQKCNVLIMDRLGDSLESLYISCNRTFDVKTVCMIGIQIVNRIQSLHREGYLHRDIKPDNFLIGAGDKNEKDGSVIHMIDMGLTKAYDIDGKHIPFKDGKRLTGTPRYASINTHNGIEQSRRDDIESLCYVLIYFLRGSLPWQGMKGMTKTEKYEAIRKKKQSTTPQELCAGLPEEFCNLLVYSRKVKFAAEPDYKFMKKILQLCCQRLSTKIDWRFTWQSPNSKVVLVPSNAEQKKEYDKDMKKKKLKEKGRDNMIRERVKMKKRVQVEQCEHHKQGSMIVGYSPNDSPRSRSKRSHDSPRREEALGPEDGHWREHRLLEYRNRDRREYGRRRQERSRNRDRSRDRDYLRVSLKSSDKLAHNELLDAYYDLEKERNTYKSRCYEMETLNIRLKKKVNELTEENKELRRKAGRWHSSS